VSGLVAFERGSGRDLPVDISVFEFCADARQLNDAANTQTKAILYFIVTISIHMFALNMLL